MSDGIIYSVIAKSAECVLCEYTESSGNFPTITRTLLKKVQEDAKFSYKYNEDFYFHYINENGVTYLCMTDVDYPMRMGFAFLDDVKDRFLDTYGYIIADAIQYQMEEFKETLRERMDFFNHDPTADKISMVRENAERVKDVMVENMQKILEKGERVELLVKKTDLMQTQATGLKRKAAEVRRSMYWRNVRMCALIILIILALAFIVFLIACNGFKCTKK